MSGMVREAIEVAVSNYVPHISGLTVVDATVTDDDTRQYEVYVGFNGRLDLREVHDDQGWLLYCKSGIEIQLLAVENESLIVDVEVDRRDVTEMDGYESWLADPRIDTEPISDIRTGIIYRQSNADSNSDGLEDDFASVSVTFEPGDMEGVFSVDTLRLSSEQTAAEEFRTDDIDEAIEKADTLAETLCERKAV